MERNLADQEKRNSAADHQLDVLRATRAAEEIVDNRPPSEFGRILVTLEHVIATVLIMSTGGDSRKAAGLLNEGIVPGVEGRLMMAEEKQRNK